MIIDSQSKFSENQAITATAISENVMDLTGGRTFATNSPADWGNGEDVDLVVTVTEAFNTLTSLTVTLETADNAGLSSGQVVLATLNGATIPLASLAAGAQFNLRLPRADYKRYLGLRFTVVGSNPTTGKITSHLALDVERRRNYRTAFAV